MKKYLYLSLIPESLIASHLAPEEFGAYFATGVFRRNCDQAIFLEIDMEDPNLNSDFLPLDEIDNLCVPHADGSAHKSLYLSVYRVLEHIPLSAYKNLYVVTSDGKVLELNKTKYIQDESEKVHMYQNIAPTRSRVASSLNPEKYIKRLTSEDRLVHFETMAFCDLKLGELHNNPQEGALNDLPYKNVLHLRDCLSFVSKEGTKNNKIVARTVYDFLYRTINKGFFFGKDDDMVYYPMPSKEELENKYFIWWKSAQASFGE